MPNGKYRGTLMKDVPAWYLVWCYENQKLRSDVAGYVLRNIETLRKKAKK